MKIALALSILIILFIIVYVILAIQLHKKVEKDCETVRPSAACDAAVLNTGRKCLCGGWTRTD